MVDVSIEKRNDQNFIILILTVDVSVVLLPPPSLQLLLLFLLLPSLFYVRSNCLNNPFILWSIGLKNWNRQNLVNFQCIELRLDSLFIRIARTIRIDRSIVQVYPSTILKKTVCVLKKCLVKHDSNFTEYHIPLAVLIQ